MLTRLDISAYKRIYDKNSMAVAVVTLLKNKNGEVEKPEVGLVALLVQGVATSIDALSVGFTISGYGLMMALICALIIAAVTFIICMVGLFIGKKVGTNLVYRANILGGVILILIGIEIFVTGIF